ncbi:thiamine phosphate synthase [soil metagenome]
MTRPRLDLSVYLITDRELCGARGVIGTVQQAVAGGVTMVQYREPLAKTRAMVEEARVLAAVLRPLGVTFVVNDRVDVALAVGADGVHVGQSDMTPADARALLGSKAILGLSITSEADLAGSDLSLVDYLGVGPIYPTLTKTDAARPMAIGGLQSIARQTKLPIVAIGGLHAGNAADVVAAGADGIAVVSAICAAPDAEAATRELVEIVRGARLAASALASSSAGIRS